MAYVELNPIRAKMADTPETSEFTSIKQRIDEERANINLKSQKRVTDSNNKLRLKRFVTEERLLTDEIPYLYREYLELVDWSGRVMREDKRGAIDSRLPPILVRLGIDEEEWHKAMQPKGAHQFSRAMGKCEVMREHAKKLAIKWIKGIGISSKLYPS